MTKRNKIDIMKKSAPRGFDESSSSSSSSSQSTSTSSWTEFSSGSGAWTDTGGGDHGGANWIPSSTEVAGTHYNIGLFQIKPDVILTVKPYDGANYGYLEVAADNIYMNHGAVINADGAGYGGGGGGGGKVAYYGSSGGAGCSGGVAGADTLSGSWSGPGGAGGTGGGAFGGTGALPSGINGVNGGYASIGVNGDTSTTQDVLMGGGGGGGSGGSGTFGDFGEFAGGGGAGGFGGGKVLFWGNNSVILYGAIYSKGMVTGGNASTATGGDASVTGTSAGAAGSGGGTGGNGAGGAGGGVLIFTPLFDGNGCTIDIRGYEDSTVNGGTVKIFSISTIASGTYLAGRVYTDDTLSSSSSSISSLSSLSSLSSSSSFSSSSSTLIRSSSSPSISESSFSSVSSQSSQSSSSQSSLSTSSVSSKSSESSSSESSISSSSISSSSSEHHLNPPYDLSFVANPFERKLTISWLWDNSGYIITTPTGFIIERQIALGSWVVVSYSILPDARAYEDILSETDAALVFAYGNPVSYRIKAYWMD